MNPDDVVLVALVNRLRDFELAASEHWYRIPARHAPKFFSGAQYLAFYFASAFRDMKWSISEYAPVRGHELVRRRDLLPEEPDHPHADELYYKMQIGTLMRREPPIPSKRGRRILFLWTTWEKFCAATEINDLFHKGPGQDRLWDALKQSKLDVERDMIVREGHSRYRIDFLIFCPKGQVAISIGNGTGSVRSRKDFRPLAFSDDELENHFEETLGRIKLQVRELSGKYLTNRSKSEHPD
jgi:hypothetical protein